ncbi:MAG TPA: Gfo/Idh/MocA family oxidoreductase [Anaerolineales bacterium]|nr:Gfo/Idh/MocA family oxidoreductase [Anaerolineales bacterium]
MSKIPVIAIIGSGWGTRVQVPAYRQAGWQVGALWARTPDKARALANEYAVPFYSADFHEILLRPEIDLVSICIPPHLHAEFAVTALQAGKHVLCEKPAALNAQQALEMAVVARSYPHQLALLDHELRFLPTRQKLRQMLRTAVLGEIYHVRVLFQANYGLALGRLWNWWAEAESGGGILGALGSHEIDQLTWLLGLRVRAVQAQLYTRIPQLPDSLHLLHNVTSDDLALIHLTFSNGVSANLELNIVQAGPNRHSLHILGSKGSVYLEDGRLLHYGAGSNQASDLSVAEEIAAPLGIPANDWWRGSVYQAQALRQWVQYGETQALQMGATFEDGLYTQQILDACRIASIQKRSIHLAMDS